MLGDRHPDTLTTMANLASTYQGQGWWEGAEKLETQAMELRKKECGSVEDEMAFSIFYGVRGCLHELSRDESSSVNHVIWHCGRMRWDRSA